MTEQEIIKAIDILRLANDNSFYTKYSKNDMIEIAQYCMIGIGSVDTSKIKSKKKAYRTVLQAVNVFNASKVCGKLI